MTLIGLAHRINTTAADVIPNISVGRYDNITADLGFNQSNVSVDPNWGSALWNTISVYPDVMGITAWVVLFSTPFVMLWIAQKDIVPAAILGIVAGVYIFAFIGSEYRFFGIAVIMLALASIVWSIWQKRG
jgi:hypothetical protein